MKILVVDDESVSRKVLLKALEALGQCEEAEDGRENRNSRRSYTPAAAAVRTMMPR